MLYKDVMLNKLLKLLNFIRCAAQSLTEEIEEINEERLRFMIESTILLVPEWGERNINCTKEMYWKKPPKLCKKLPPVTFCFAIPKSSSMMYFMTILLQNSEWKTIITEKLSPQKSPIAFWSIRKRIILRVATFVRSYNGQSKGESKKNLFLFSKPAEIIAHRLTALTKLGPVAFLCFRTKNQNCPPILCK